MARSGHRVQVLTSGHRLPPIGQLEERGVFREFCLYEDSKHANKLGNCYHSTLGHEDFNREVLADRLAHFKPDIVWVWNMRGLSKSLLFYLQASGIRVVYDLHANWLKPQSFEEDPWYRWWHTDRRLRSRIRRKWHGLGRARRARRGLPDMGHPAELDIGQGYLCSEALQRDLVGSGITQAASLPVIYPFSDESKIIPKTSYNPGGRCLMWAGRINWSRGPDLALRAVALLKERGVDTTLDLLVMGSPSERKVLRGEIEAMGLHDEVRIRGIRPGEQYQYYQKYDALLYTSRGNDPFPITVQEAILSKLPCVFAKTGGIPEIFDGLETGIDFEAGDAAALAGAIERLFQLEDGGKAIAEAKIASLRRAGTFESLKEHVEKVAD
jgi:glycosyltransferase involved in cell wall biosynthesis